MKNPRDVPSIPGESYWDWYARVVRVLGQPEPQKLEDPIPPRLGPTGEGLDHEQ